MKRIVVLGSTGSIGTQTLDVVRRHPDKLQVVALAANSRAEELLAQAREFGVRHLAVGDERLAGEAVADDLRAQAEDGLRCAAAQAAVGVPGVAGARATQGGLRADAGASDASNANARSSDTERGEGSLGFGAQAVAALAQLPEADVVVNALVGARSVPVHVEVRVKDGHVTPIEFNPLRFAGLGGTDVSFHAYGYRTYEAFLEGRDPDFDAAFSGKDGKVYTMSLLNPPADATGEEAFDYDAFAARFSNVLELRRFDADRVGSYGFLFLETDADSADELDFLMRSDLKEFLR